MLVKHQGRSFHSARDKQKSPEEPVKLERKKQSTYHEEAKKASYIPAMAPDGNYKLNKVSVEVKIKTKGKKDE